MLKEAIKIKPDIALIHYHLGMAYLKKDLKGLAKMELEKSLSLDKNHQRAPEANEIIDKMNRFIYW